MISTKERSNLRALANKLRPLINVGKGGISENLLKEIDVALYNNELIKLNILKSCVSEPQELMNIVCEELEAEAIQCIGGKLVIYKFSNKDGFEHIEF